MGTPPFSQPPRTGLALARSRRAAGRGQRRRSLLVGQRRQLRSAATWPFADSLAAAIPATAARCDLVQLRTPVTSDLCDLVQESAVTDEPQRQPNR